MRAEFADRVLGEQIGEPVDVLQVHQLRVEIAELPDLFDLEQPAQLGDFLAGEGRVDGHRLAPASGRAKACSASLMSVCMN